MLRVICILAALVLGAAPALAHKVIAGVFPAGDTVEGELGFSNGTMAVDQLVEVFGPDGEKLGETRTDADGFFTYIPTRPIAHRFTADMGAGHVADVTMEAADIAKIVGDAAPESVTETTPDTPANAAATRDAPAPAVTIASLTDEERDAIAAIVRDETRPLRREITAYKEHNNVQTILGGIGYIVGLFGLGFYVAARRRLAKG